jgi:hypothetical protein
MRRFEALGKRPSEQLEVQRSQEKFLLYAANHRIGGSNNRLGRNRKLFLERNWKVNYRHSGVGKGGQKISCPAAVGLKT